MAHFDPPFEIHVHGEVPLNPEVRHKDVEEALKPLWRYAGARSLREGASSYYDEEPGILFDAREHMLRMCWTVRGDEDFRQHVDDMCMNLNDLARAGAPIEVTFYDTQFDDDDDDIDHSSEEEASRDDFMVVFVGPTPAAIMQVQRDLLVQDVVGIMERHFDSSELQGVVDAIDTLFTQRFAALVSSLELGTPPRTGAPGSAHHGNGRNKPRHLH